MAKLIQTVSSYLQWVSSTVQCRMFLLHLAYTETSFQYIKFLKLVLQNETMLYSGNRCFRNKVKESWENLSHTQGRHSNATRSYVVLSLMEITHSFQVYTVNNNVLPSITWWVYLIHYSFFHHLFWEAHAFTKIQIAAFVYILCDKKMECINIKHAMDKMLSLG